MKRYEMPMVELTKFDVEDIMTGSGVAPAPTYVDTKDVNNGDVQAAIMGATGADAVAVYNW